MEDCSVTHTLVYTTRIHNCARSLSEIHYVKAQMLAPAGESLHKCDVCQKRFSHRRYLKTCIFIHVGGRPHKCGIHVCEELCTQ